MAYKIVKVTLDILNINSVLLNFKVLKFPAFYGNGLIINEVFISFLFILVILSNILQGCYNGGVAMIIIRW